MKFQLENELHVVNKLNGCSTVGKEIIVSFVALIYTVPDIFHMDGMKHLAVCMSSWSGDGVLSPGQRCSMQISV